MFISNCNYIIFSCNITFEQFNQDINFCRGPHGYSVSQIDARYTTYGRMHTQILNKLFASKVVKQSHQYNVTQLRGNLYSHKQKISTHGPFVLTINDELLWGVLYISMADCKGIVKDVARHLCGKNPLLNNL